MSPLLKGSGDSVTAGTNKVVTNQQTPTLEEVLEDMSTGDVLMKIKGECRE